MRNNYKRKDRQPRTFLQRPPTDRVNPPHEDERRRRWTNRLHPGTDQHNIGSHGGRKLKQRTSPH